MRRACLAAAALMAATLLPGGSAGTQPPIPASPPEPGGGSFVPRNGRPSVRPEGFRLPSPRDLDADYERVPGLQRDVNTGLARPTALASGDLDNDGVPDLIAAYAYPDRGVISVHRGNVDAIYPHHPDAVQRKAQGHFTDAPFLSPALVFRLPGAPDFLAAGDFDADGHLDVVAATAGGADLLFLAGDGHGDLAPARRLALGGQVTGMISGEVNRADGLVDLAVAVTRPRGAAVLIFQGPRGAVQEEALEILVSGEISAMALARLDEDPFVDLVVGAPDELLLYPGRDRQLQLPEERRLAPPPATPQRLAAFPSEIRAIVPGDFVDDPQGGPELAVLLADGTVEVLKAEPGPETASATARPGTSWRNLGQRHLAREIPRGVVALKARVSGISLEELVIGAPDVASLVVLLGESTGHDGVRQSGEAVSADLEAGPVAILPMRLNRDALKDLVVLASGRPPAVLESVSAATFIVDIDFIDLPDFNPGDGLCFDGFLGCTLRAAIEEANALPGADLIEFNLGAGPATIFPSSALPPITEAVTIDGSSQPGFIGVPLIRLEGSTVDGPGLTLAGAGITVRSLQIVDFGTSPGVCGGTCDGILISQDGNIIEGSFLGTDGLSAIPNMDSGARIQFSIGNLIGGTAPGAGNVISSNGTYGVRIVGFMASGNEVQGNLIGVDQTGGEALGNSAAGILVDSAPSNTIGGTVAGSGNVISANTDDGVLLFAPAASGNLVQGNIIGMDVSGTVGLANGGSGVQITGSPLNTVGGTGALAGNLISRNGAYGTHIDGLDAGANLVLGNDIGIDVTGSVAEPNTFDGVRVRFADGNIIGGVTAIARNVISGNGLRGVSLYGADLNEIRGNFIGTDFSGNIAVPNTASGVGMFIADSNTVDDNVISGNFSYGIFIESSNGTTVDGNLIGVNETGTLAVANALGGIGIEDSAAFIGSAAPGDRNIISGNGGHGITFVDATGTQVLGNFIGTDASGLAALGNSGDGIYFDASSFNVIGDSGASDGNVISGNSGHGIRIHSLSSQAAENTIWGNLIGTDSTGSPVLGNGMDGIRLQDSPTNEIGGLPAGAGNVIAGNVGNGINVVEVLGSSIDNRIERNSIFANGLLGIDLGDDGITPNDPLDADGSPNHFQNVPYITSVRINPVITIVTGLLESTPSTDHRIELFTNAACDPSGSGEGAEFLGAVDVTTGADGSVAFEGTFASNPPGLVVTATATDPFGNTSEFSPCDTSKVISVIPADNALGVPVGINVTLTFSKPVLPGTANSSSIQLLGPGGAPVPATVAVAPGGVIVTLDPDPLPTGMLALGTTYVVTVSSDVRDLSGVPVTLFTSFFATEAAGAGGSPLPDVGDQVGLPPGQGPPPAPEALSAVTLGDNLGFSVAHAGDLNGDGIEDFLGGAPGYPVGGNSEAGTAVIYLGSDMAAERVQPDVVFTGGSAHHRAGAALAGNFDFNGDGVKDLLIGAEDVDRELSTPVAVGEGKVYLIYFDPLEYDLNGSGVADYEQGTCSLNAGVVCLGDDDCTMAGAGVCSEPGPPVFVELSDVGTNISGVVFTGINIGDQAGFSLAAGSALNPGLGDDIVIGVPGADGGDGRVYVIYDDPALTGSHSLSLAPFTLPGFILTGSAAERLGNAVALPGDVIEPAGDDIAVGAPLAAPAGAVEAGTVYLVPGGSLPSGSAFISDAPTRITGDQAGAQLGFSVAGGGDNRADGDSATTDPDLLMGAPFHDTDGGAVIDAGRVLQTSGRLDDGIIPAADVGDEVDGVIWEGAADGDLLGWAVGRVGDVTGNGLEDVSLGAPFANPGESDAGAVYLIEGSANAGLGGTVEVSLVGQTTSGTVFIGTQPDERAGLVMSAAGDVSDDGGNDFTVGAPGFRTCTESGSACLDDMECTGGGSDLCADDAGTVHVVLDSRPLPPGRCSSLGCTVVDLATGAQMVVPAAALAGTVNLAVRGLIDPLAHEDAACDPLSVFEKSLVAVADFDSENQGFAMGLDPVIDVPTSEAAEYQLTLGESLNLYYCQGTFGWFPVGTGVVKDNEYVSGRLAVESTVDTLHLWAAFVEDADQDGARTMCDCADGDPTLWAFPGEVGELQLSHDPDEASTLLAWTAPAFPGGSSPAYDTIRSGDPNDFVTATDCVESDDAADTVAVDTTILTLGEILYYIVQAHNGCSTDPGCQAPFVGRAARNCP